MTPRVPWIDRVAQVLAAPVATLDDLATVTGPLVDTTGRGEVYEAPAPRLAGTAAVSVVTDASGRPRLLSAVLEPPRQLDDIAAEDPRWLYDDGPSSPNAVLTGRTTGVTLLARVEGVVVREVWLRRDTP